MTETMNFQETFFIATNVNKKYGYTVICASNHWDKKSNPLEQDIAVINKYCRDNHRIQVTTIANANHNFKRKLPEFINLPEQYWFDAEPIN